MLASARSSPVSLYLNRHGPLEQVDGNYQPVVAFEFRQNALDARKGTAYKLHALANLQEGPRSCQQFRGYNTPYSLNLLFGHRSGSLSHADQMHDAGGCQHWKAVTCLQTTEYVPTEERNLHFLDPIRPSASSTVCRQELFITSGAQLLRNHLFEVRLHPYCIPRKEVASQGTLFRSIRILMNQPMLPPFQSQKLPSNLARSKLRITHSFRIP